MSKSTGNVDHLLQTIEKEGQNYAFHSKTHNLH